MQIKFPRKITINKKLQGKLSQRKNEKFGAVM